MEEENNNIKKHPNLPSNYVTLLQFQERWIKEKQRKQKEKEEEEEAAKQKQKQQENHESGKKPKDARPIGRISNQRYQWRNRNLKEIGAGADRGETNAAVPASVLVEENGNESGVNKEVKREDLRNKKKKKWNEKKKKEKKEKDGEEARAQNKEKAEEEQEQKQEEARRDAHAPPVISARRSEKKSEARMEYRPKINDAMETGDAIVADIEGKFGDVSIGMASDRLSLRRQNRVINHRDRAYRGYYSVVDRSNGHYRGGYGNGINRGTGHRKGGNWKFNRGNERGTGVYTRFNGSRERNGSHGATVWVRKEEVADGGNSGDVTVNQSSGGSFKELE